MTPQGPIMDLVTCGLRTTGLIPSFTFNFKYYLLIYEVFLSIKQTQAFISSFNTDIFMHLRESKP
jgi:hypothetical protein